VEKEIQMPEHKHRFTTIPINSDHRMGAAWQWCIRCGALKRGTNICRPGPEQKASIIADEK
jgi:hypothetical protein